MVPISPLKKRSRDDYLYSIVKYFILLLNFSIKYGTTAEKMRNGVLRPSDLY